MNTFIKENHLTNGSVLILTSFLLLIITLITISYWKLIQIRLMILTNNEQEIRAYYAAKSGIEDAIYEFKSGHSWSNDPHSGLSNNWQFYSENTFYKTNINNSSSLTHFNYPTTISVNVIENLEQKTRIITSTAVVKRNTNSQDVFKQSLQAVVIESFNGNQIIKSLKKGT